jgi:hypothetical protein
MTHPGGRPTVYTEDTAKTALAYITNYANFGDRVPSNVGLARVLEIGTTTLYRWNSDDEKPEFRAILEKLQNTQERILLNMGLDGTYNSNIVKLMLGKHGYKEQKDTSLSNSDGSPLFDKIKISLVQAAETDE